MDTLETVGFLPGIPDSCMPTSTNTRLEMSENALKDIPLRKSIRTSGVSTRVATQESTCPYLTVASKIWEFNPKYRPRQALKHLATDIPSTGGITLVMRTFGRLTKRGPPAAAVSQAQDTPRWRARWQRIFVFGIRFERGARFLRTLNSARCEADCPDQNDMEFARRIFADPRIPAMNDRVNAVVKVREGYRPFAPSGS